MGIDTKGFQPNPDITEQELAEMRIDVADRIIVVELALTLQSKVQTQRNVIRHICQDH